MTEGAGDARRPGAFERVPLVRRCQLTFDDGHSRAAFLVNVSVVGAYVALDDAPPLGARIQCRFSFPHNSREVQTEGVVVWLNPRQQHPVHSLPPGIGLRFEGLSEADRARIETFVNDHLRSRARPR
jgi:uncharacterized protein (TIGR02266 family)